MRVKIEVNTREHFDVYGIHGHGFAVSNPWFSGEAEIQTYTLPELLGTKLRALYQRKKGRDLFDLALGLEQPDCDPERLVKSFEGYMEHGGTPVTRAQLEANMADKITDPAFLGDAPPLLRTGLEFDPAAAWARVHEVIVTRLRGDPWKGP